MVINNSEIFHKSLKDFLPERTIHIIYGAEREGTGGNMHCELNSEQSILLRTVFFLLFAK